MMAEEDRISNLPDDIIHHILSFLDLKYAMQTSALSKKWKLVWSLLPQLNLDSYNYSNTSHFNKFVKHALLHRNNLREVSVLELRCRGVVTQFTGKSIVNYAGLHNVRRMSIVWAATKLHEFPQFLFSCRAIEDLSLEVQDRNSCLTRCYISESGWDFPALEKLNLKNFQLDGGENKRINLFSKCVNLKDLTLHEIDTRGLEELTLCVPQLSNLAVTFRYRYSYPKVLYPKVFNVVAPQLQNLTASVDSIVVLHCRDLLQKSAEGFDSLKKVNLSWPETHYVSKKKTCLSELLGVFQKLYNAKFLTLDSYILMVLSSSLDQLLLEPCPFTNLKFVKINTILGTTDGCIAKTTCLTSQNNLVVPIQLKSYFLDKSPSATYITDYPQVPQKRPLQNVHDDAMANNLTKSEAETKLETKLPVTIKEQEAKIPMQDQVTTKQNEMFDVEIEMQDKVPHKRSSQQVHDDATAKKMAKLDVEKQQPYTITEAKEMLDASIKMQDEVISKQEAMFEAKMQMQEQAIRKQKAMFEAHIQMLDQVIITQKAMYEHKIQMQDQVNANQKVMFEDEREMQGDVEHTIHIQDQANTKQKAMFEAKIQMQDLVITKQKAMFEAKMHMQDQVMTKQKVMFEAKIQMLDQVSASQKAMLEAKLQMQDNVIAEHKSKIQMVEVTKLDHEKLITHVMKSKIAELQVQVESGNPDYEVIRLIGSEIKSIMELIPESLRAVIDAQFCYEYVKWKSLFLTHIDASQWSKIEIELGIINGL